MGLTKSHSIYMYCMSVDRSVMQVGSKVSNISLSVIVDKADNGLRINKVLMITTMA